MAYILHQSSMTILIQPEYDFLLILSYDYLFFYMDIEREREKKNLSQSCLLYHKIYKFSQTIINSNIYF